MKTSRIVFVVAVAVASAAMSGCRQPDGAVPKQDEEQVNRTADLSRDLQNVARGDQNAVNDLADDLQVIGRLPAPPERVRELAGALQTALAGKTISDEAARRLADSLFVVMAARQLSERQVETLQTEITIQAKAAGADDARAANIANAVARLQGDVTANRKRWYQF
jgi:hypothetical protein